MTAVPSVPIPMHVTFKTRHASHLGQYVVACSYSLRAALGSRKSCHVMAAHAYQMCGLPGAHAVPRWKQRAAAARLPRRRSSTAHCGDKCGSRHITDTHHSTLAATGGNFPAQAGSKQLLFRVYVHMYSSRVPVFFHLFAGPVKK
jgi:hypothetical protein